MKIIVLFSIFFTVLLSCQNKKNVDPKAASLHKTASNVFKNNPTNRDSLIYAVILLDSAIHIDSIQMNFYFTKCQISMKLKKYDVVINSCNKVLAVDKNNFLAMMEKGIASELDNRNDSAMDIYKQALLLIDKTKFQNSIFKEHQRIILYGLLKDTANFNSKLKQFNNRFRSQEEFQEYYEDLIHFNKIDYINSY